MRTKKKWIGLVSLAAFAVPLGATAQTQTPEQKAAAAGQGGRIPNASAQEFYLGEVRAGDTKQGLLFGAVAGALPSMVWYKYVSDGVTGVTFDQFGSAYSFGSPGGSALSSGPDGELAIFNSLGQYVAGNEAPRAPTTGDSNLPAIIPEGAPAPPSDLNRGYAQPKDPTKPLYKYNGTAASGSWVFQRQGLSQLSFVPNAQTNPSDPNTTDWDEYNVLPAGTYFLAVSAFQTRFSGNPRDAGAFTPGGSVTSTTPFGFISLNAQSGIYTLNARRVGDLTLDNLVNINDYDLLTAKKDQFAGTNGIPDAGFTDGLWTGLPADTSDPGSDLQRFDLTANSRIDIYDLLSFTRYTGLTRSSWTLPGSGTWKVAESWTLGFPNAVGSVAVFGSSISADSTVTSDSAVTAGVLRFDNLKSYLISGQGSLTVSNSLGDALVDVVKGTHTVALPTTFATSTDVAVAAGSEIRFTGAATLSSGATLTKDGAGQATFSGPLGLTGGTSASNTSVIVTAGTLQVSRAVVGSVDVASGATFKIMPGTVSSDLGALTIAAGGFVDLTTSSVLLRSTTEALVQAQVARWWNDGQRTADGLGTSSTLALGTLGIAVSGSDVLVKFTYIGDTNLSGTVDGTDLAKLIRGIRLGLSGWSNGDTNYDGVVNGLDYANLVRAISGQGGPLGEEVTGTTVGTGAGVIPEPGPVGVGLVVACWGAARRRRTR